MVRSIGLEQKIRVKMSMFSYPYVLAYVLGAQKNRLIEKEPSHRDGSFEYQQHMF